MGSGYVYVYVCITAGGRVYNSGEVFVNLQICLRKDSGV